MDLVTNVFKTTPAFRSTQVVAFSYAVGLAALSIAILTFRIDPWWSLLPAAMVFGWTQISGPCGGALIGALTMYTQVRNWKRWGSATSAYTFGGLLSSIALGTILGWVGRTLHHWLGASPLISSFFVISMLL